MYIVKCYKLLQGFTSNKYKLSNSALISFNVSVIYRICVRMFVFNSRLFACGRFKCISEFWALKLLCSALSLHPDLQLLLSKGRLLATSNRPSTQVRPSMQYKHLTCWQNRCVIVCVSAGASTGSKNTLYPSISIYKSDTSGEFYIPPSSPSYHILSFPSLPTSCFPFLSFLTSFFLPYILLSLTPFSCFDLLPHFPLRFLLISFPFLISFIYFLFVFLLLPFPSLTP